MAFLVSTQLSYTQPITSQAKEYAKQHNMNTEMFVLIDFRIYTPEGLRFQVIDLNDNSYIEMFRTLQGIGNGNYGFSNIPESHQSSLGKYRLGKIGWSSWGSAKQGFLLHGLEDTNSNAAKRLIKIHGMNEIPDDINEPNTAISYGCPALSNKDFKIFKDLVAKQSNKNILVWIIN